MKIEILDIKIGQRFRQDLGDIDTLAKSIKELGLLQPIVITENNELICGRRRIAAVAKLGQSEISAIIATKTISSEAEAAENIVRKNFSNSEIAEIDQFYREREEAAARERQRSGKSKSGPLGNFPTGRSREKISAIVGISDRTLEKLRVIKKIASENPEQCGHIWHKVGSQKMRIDKGFNYVKKFVKIQEAQKQASSFKLEENNSLFDLYLGPMQEKGSEIADSLIDLIFTDPPYNEESIPLYGDLAKLAQRVLKPGGSLITFIGHYALFKIGKLIAENSDLEYHWQLIVKHNGRTAKMWKQRVWPKYKPMLWYYKPKEGQNGPTMFSDIEDLIESEPVDKTLHDWQQSTVEAERVIKTLTVENQTLLDPFMGSGTTGIAAMKLNRRFTGIEVDKDHFAIAKAHLIKAQRI